MTTDMFIGLVRKYTRARKLTPRMLNELIEKIEVFNAEKIDGVWEQRLRIHYNCVGTIEIPTVLPLPIPELIPLPAPEVSVNTRKGVVVNYAPCELAMVPGAESEGSFPTLIFSNFSAFTIAVSRYGARILNMSVRFFS